MINRYPLSILLFLIWSSLNGQSNYTISGYLYDEKNGETLIAGNVYNKDSLEQGTYTNDYGFYSLTLPEGEYILSYSYLGFQEQIKKVDLRQNIRLNVNLSKGILIDELTITAIKEDEDINVKGTQMGTIGLSVESIKRLPSLMGEVDILKAIQLLPGVLSSGEGRTNRRQKTPPSPTRLPADN